MWRSWQVDTTLASFSTRELSSYEQEHEGIAIISGFFFSLSLSPPPLFLSTQIPRQQ